MKKSKSSIPRSIVLLGLLIAVVITIAVIALPDNTGVIWGETAQVAVEEPVLIASGCSIHTFEVVVGPGTWASDTHCGAGGTLTCSYLVTADCDVQGAGCSCS